MKLLNLFTESLRNLLFPKKCQSCGAGFEYGLSNILCGACFDAIAPYADPVCGHCGISLSPGAFEGAARLRCRDCGEDDYFIDQVRAVGPYGGALRIAHHGFKFEGMGSLQRDLAAKMVSAANPGFWEGVEALVPVPLSAERERERGYNPAGLLAQEISRVIHIPFYPLLRKVKSTQPQMSLRREERLRNPRGAYQWVNQMRIPSKLVLVDDVFTTGATLEECAKVLKKAGAGWVGAIVFGRTPRYF